MNISQKGIDLIKSFEGCRLESYKDAAGVWTIGYGHTGNVRSGEKITQAQAEELLKSDLTRYVNGVNSLVRVKLNQNQFDALVSFAYNLGISALGSSTLLKYLNDGKFRDAANEFGRWVHAGGKVLNGLVRRREAEKKLFLTPVHVHVPYPGHLIRLAHPYMRGEEIKKIQKKVGAKADGIFGPKTEAAVKAFQKKHGLLVDGIVGPKTWAKLFN